MKKGNTKQKHYHPAIGIVVILVLALVAALLVRHQPKDASVNDLSLVKHDAAVTTASKNGEVVPKLKNTLSMSEQKAGSSVVVDEVSLQKPGYVVLHEDTAGKPGKIVVHSGLLAAGTKQDLVIRLATKSGTNYFAMLHSDNGDGKFDETKDLPINGANAMPIMVMFSVIK